METMILGGVTRDKLDEARRQIAQSSGMVLEGDSGSVAKGGYEGTYKYNQATRELTLILTRKPRLVPMWAIRSKLLAAVKDFGIYERKQV